MGFFNSNEFAWKDISINILGLTLSGVSNVKYSTEKGKEYLYGKGDEPLAIQHTNKGYPGEITLFQSVVEALEAAARKVNANFDVTDIDFDIIVSYGVGVLTKTDIIKGASIDKYEKGMGQGDKNMEVTLTFKAIGIQRGA